MRCCSCGTITRGPHQPFCSFHWNTLTVPMQRLLVRLYRSGRPLPGYEDAVANATIQIRDKLANPHADPFRAAPEPRRVI